MQGIGPVSIARFPAGYRAEEATMSRLSMLVRRWSLPSALTLAIGACGATPPTTPPATPPCSATSVSDVEAALEDVTGYTFAASGTSLRSRPQADRSDPWRYDSPPIELRGAYRAPDRSRLEVVVGKESRPLSDPPIFFLGADAIVVIEGWLWLVSGDSIVGPGKTDAGTSNLLLNVLRGPVGGGFELTWVRAGACRFLGLGEQGAISGSVEVDVGTGALPTRIVEEWRYEPPNEPRRGYDLTYLPDFARVPEIDAPVPAGSSPQGSSATSQ